MDTLDLDRLDHDTALAMLLWQVELGATESFGDAPVNRYELVEPVSPAPARAAPAAAALPAMPTLDPVAEAQAAAEAAADLEALRAALTSYEHCELKRGARNTVFGDGHPAARVMVIGEVPDREEDSEGRPFVGAPGRLLDRMLAAIGLGREGLDPARAVYLATAMPWRPPQGRDPLPEEIGMMRPFLARHVALVDPDVLIVMGNAAATAVLGRGGITRMRGRWAEAWGRPVLPMCHPGYLLRNPDNKRDAWADLLALKARLG